jgi:DNA-binding response OmpR family regulator
LRDSVLVVDDDADIRAFLEAALADAGYEVRTAADGVEALGALDGWRPGAVLLDLRLPRLDGWGVCERLSARPDLDGVAVVAMSASEHLRRPFRGLQPAAALAKPLDVPELLATLWVATNP